jgi:signal transduction histidine kinase
MRRSVYAQLVSVLIGIIFISNVLVFFGFTLTTERAMLSEMEEAMSTLADHVRSLHGTGVVTAERIAPLLGGGYFRADIFDSIADLEQHKVVQRSFSEETLSQLKWDDVVGSHSLDRKRWFSLPAVILRLPETSGTRYLLIYPDLSKMLFNFRRTLARVNVTSLLVGSVMILLAAKYIVRPVKELSRATEEITQGNFDVVIKEKRRDEIGQLIDGFNRMAKELQDIEMMRSDFISAISHEFRTPLTSIKGYTQLLRQAEDEAERRQYAGIILEETDRLSQLASNILLLNRLEQEGGEMMTSEFRLDEQIRKVVLLLEGLWSKKNLELEIDLQELSFCGNEQLLFQVWLNILDNAIKFSHYGGCLEIRLYEKSGYITCSFKDYGVGISSESQRRLFEKFYKGDHSRGTSGNGLGLAIAKHIVDMHEGTIKVSSSEGRGTEVTVILQT